MPDSQPIPKPVLVAECSVKYQAAFKPEKTAFNVTGEYTGEVKGNDGEFYDISIVLHQAGRFVIGYYAIFDKTHGSLVDPGLYQFEGVSKGSASKTKRGKQIVFTCKLWCVNIGEWKAEADTTETCILMILNGKGKPTTLEMPDLEKGVYRRRSKKAVLPFQKRMQQTPQRQWWRLGKGGSFPAKKETDTIITEINSGMKNIPLPSGSASAFTAVKNIQKSIRRFREKFDNKTYDLVEWVFALSYIRAMLQTVNHDTYGTRLAYLPDFLNIAGYDPYVQGALGILKPVPVTKYYAYRWRLHIKEEDPSSKAREEVGKWKKRFKKLLNKTRKIARKAAKILMIIPLRVTGVVEVRRYEAGARTKFNWTAIPATWKYDLELYVWEMTIWNSFFDDGDSKWGATPPNGTLVPRNTVVSTEQWSAKDFETKGWFSGAFRLYGIGGANSRKLGITFVAPSGKQNMSGTAELSESDLLGGGAYARGNLFLLTGSTKSRVASPFMGKRRDVPMVRKQRTLFAYGKWEINPKMRESIRKFCAENLAELRAPKSRVIIYGYASFEKNEWAAKDLERSKNRACAVMQTMNAFLGNKALAIGRNVEVGGGGHVRAKRDKQDAKTQKNWRRVDVILNGRTAISFYGKAGRN